MASSQSTYEFALHMILLAISGEILVKFIASGFDDWLDGGQ